MGKIVLINEKSLSLIKENLNEFVVDKKSNFGNHNSCWFVLYRGDMLFFDYQHQDLLDGFIARHAEELGEFVHEYKKRKNKDAKNDFDRFICWVGWAVPYLISGYVCNGREIWVNKNEHYDVLHSKELKQLVKQFNDVVFYFDGKKINSDEIVNTKGDDVAKVWYHGTRCQDALYILKKGLRPTPDNSPFPIQHDKTVFLTSDYVQAKWYANYKQHFNPYDYGMNPWQTSPCVLEIDGEKLDSNKFVYDYDVYNGHLANKDDTVYNDRMKERDITYDSKSNVIQKSTDPRKYKKVGYRGIIMPNAVKSVTVIANRLERNMSIEEFMNLMKENNVVAENVESDVYEIGQESDNPPVGGNYCHVEDEINESSTFDSSMIGMVEYTWDFDSEEYQEWLIENEYTDSENAKIEYIRDCVTFELEYFDNETLHHCGYDNVDYDTLESEFGEKMAQGILNNCLSNGEGKFETSELYSDEDVDVNNNESINNYTMKLFKHGDYSKNCRGFILTNGVVVYTEAEHNEITRIPNVNTKFDFIRMGNIRVLPNSIDIGKEPTYEQKNVLRKIIASYEGEKLYVDFFTQGGGEYGVKYINPNVTYVLGEINRFYSEGIKPQGGTFYEKKNTKTKLVENKTYNNDSNFMNENFDFEVDSSEIDLSSFKKQNDLAPIWDGDEILDSRIRLKLLDIADDFWEFVNLTWVKPSGIILTGSICNFNWSSFSDIDLHLIVDFDEIDEKTEFVRDYLDAKKNEWNNEHEDLKILGYPVELYVQNLDEMPQSGGIYDLEENEWIKKPSPNDIKAIGLDKFSIKDKAARIMTIIDDMYDTFSSTNDSHEIEEIGKDAQYLWKKIKAMRKQSLEERGESGIGNICYKYMRRMGYLDKLWKLRTLCYDKTNSINESVDEMQAWHGTDVVFDKFDLAFLSKGEGSQEYGKGIYVTSSKSTGEHYIEIIRGTRMNTKGKEYMQKKHDASDDEKEEATQDFQNFLDNYDSIYDNLPGYLYKVDIPDDNGNNYFDYTAPMSPQKARNVFINYCKEGLIKNSKYSDERFNRLVKRVNSDIKWDNVKNGRDFHIALYDEGIDLSKVVASMGYIGTKVPIGYLHGMKYGRGKNKMNYVIFDPQNIKIISRKDILANKTTRFNESKNIIKEYLEKDNNLPLINENIDTFKLAKEHFGTTYDIRECGYILPSGEMLDFSGRHEITRPSDATHLNGRRGIDHRCIYEIGWNINKDTKLFDITMEDFIRQGAVRISPSNSWSTINLYVKPTKEQIDVISRLVRFSHGNVTVEIGDGNESLSYAEYDEAKPSRVIGEILRYFDEGVNLMGNVSESKKIFKNKTIKEYLTLLKKSSINEEIVADGSANHNPYAKRWKAERKALKDFICNFGKIMTSRENGKQYKCYYDQTLSQLIGFNFCICLQWDPINLKPSSTLYIRALDKFTDRIFQAQYDDRGKDNVRGTYDDINYGNT